MRAAAASVLCLVGGLLVFLLGAGDVRIGWPFMVLLASVLASFAFAVVALASAGKGDTLSGSRRGLVAVVGVSMLAVFVLSIYAVIESLSRFN